MADLPEFDAAHYLDSQGSQYPELTVSAMVEAIKAPNANPPNGKGSAYATILFLYLRKNDLVKDVLVYVQRRDLTGQKLLDFLTGIRATSLMPDAVIAQYSTISMIRSPRSGWRHRGISAPAVLLSGRD